MLHLPTVDPNGPFQMQITTLDYSSYVGTIGIGRITARMRLKTNMPVSIIDREGKTRPGRISASFRLFRLRTK